MCVCVIVHLSRQSTYGFSGLHETPCVLVEGKLLEGILALACLVVQETDTLCMERV